MYPRYSYAPIDIVRQVVEIIDGCTSDQCFIQRRTAFINLAVLLSYTGDMDGAIKAYQDILKYVFPHLVFRFWRGACAGVFYVLEMYANISTLLHVFPL